MSREDLLYYRYVCLSDQWPAKWRFISKLSRWKMFLTSMLALCAKTYCKHTWITAKIFSSMFKRFLLSFQTEQILIISLQLFWLQKLQIFIAFFSFSRNSNALFEAYFLNPITIFKFLQITKSSDIYKLDKYFAILKQVS